MKDFNWDDTSRALQITNEDRGSLDAYIRFNQSTPCWDETSNSRTARSARPGDVEPVTDGLHYFTMRD